MIDSGGCAGVTDDLDSVALDGIVAAGIVNQKITPRDRGDGLPIHTEVTVSQYVPFGVDRNNGFAWLLIQSGA